jgi:hypothetical protein
MLIEVVLSYTKTLKFDAYEPILKDFFHTNSSHQILDVGKQQGYFSLIGFVEMEILKI